MRNDKKKPEMIRIYKNQTVYEAALDRIRWIFDEFSNIIVGMSGGKDSTVVFNLALQVAREKNRLPLKVLFVDQEAEWQATIDFIKKIMYRGDVEPKWYQMPIRLFNATSSKEHWLYCWDPEAKDKWIHEQDPISVKRNIYGTDRFKEIFKAILRVEYPNTPTAYLAGVRAEESPQRYMGLTYAPKYKWVTWVKTLDKKRKHYTFYPIYDWSYTDVWKAIFDNGWEYNKVYNYLYAYGVPLSKIRVSNLHHETAVHVLFVLQEIEPETYERLSQRLPGIDTAGKLGKENFFVHKLPFMFSSWKEYRDYLFKYILDDEYKPKFKKAFNKAERFYEVIGEKLYEIEIQSIITNDVDLVKFYDVIGQPHGPYLKYRAMKKRGRSKDGRPK